MQLYKKSNEALVKAASEVDLDRAVRKLQNQTTETEHKYY